MELNKKTFSFFKDELMLNSAIVFLGTSLGGVLDLIYQLIAARILTTKDFGTFNTLMSLVLFFSIAINPLGITFTRFFTEYITKKDFSTLTFILNKIVARLLIVASIVFLLFHVLSADIAVFLKTKATYLTVCGGIIAFSILSIPFSALLQSFQKFKTFSFVWISSSFGKLILGGFLMFSGWGILGGLIGFLIGLVLIISLALFFIAKIFQREIKQIDRKISVSTNLVSMYKYSLLVFISKLSFALLINIDIILVKHFFSPLSAGYYSLAQMVGKIVLFLPSALAIVILPKSAEAYVSNKVSFKLLYDSIFLGCACCFVVICASFLFPDIILKLIFGNTNPESRALVGLFSLAMSFNALLWIATNFSLAIHNFKFILPLLFIAILETFFIFCYHPTLNSVVCSLLFFSIISFLVALLTIESDKRLYLKAIENQF